MRNLVADLSPKIVLYLADYLVGFLPVSLKQKYHNLSYEPKIDFISSITHPSKKWGLLLPSQSYVQNVKVTDKIKAITELKANIEYHLKLNHCCIIMVNYLDSAQSNELKELASSLKKHSIILNASFVKDIFSTQKDTVDFFKANDLLIINQTNTFTNEPVSDFEIFNSQLEHELRFGKRTIQYIYDVTKNPNIYYQ